MRGVHTNARLYDKGIPVDGKLRKMQKNPVMVLNEATQINLINGWEWVEKGRRGPDHCPHFSMAVAVGDCEFEASASTKKAAKNLAAEKAVEALGL